MPYFTDGGAGGELYANETEKVGVDSGYWYGYRLVRVARDAITTTRCPSSCRAGSPSLTRRYVVRVR